MTKNYFWMVILVIALVCIVIACTDDRIGVDSDGGAKVADLSFILTINDEADASNNPNKSKVEEDKIIKGTSSIGHDFFLSEEEYDYRHPFPRPKRVDFLNGPLKNPALKAATIVGNIPDNTDYKVLVYNQELNNGLPGRTSFQKELTVSSDGAPDQSISWGESKTLRFLALYPDPEINDNIETPTLSSPFDQMPSYNNYNITFTVNENVEDQQDLLYAHTDAITYDASQSTQQVGLQFDHALTAVQFFVGENLIKNKTIKKIEIQNVYSKGKLNLSTGEWSSLENQQTFAVDNLDFETDVAQNTAILSDNYTFQMIPQNVANAKVIIYFDGNEFVSFSLSGNWEAGKTKRYKLNASKVIEKYVLETASPDILEWNQESGTFGVTSYKKEVINGINTKTPVSWEITEYSTNGYLWHDLPQSWVMPHHESGDGSINQENDYFDVSCSIENIKEIIDNQLKNNTAVVDINLAGKDNVRPANCYVVSAPGTNYHFPLYYGNGVFKDGGDPNIILLSTGGMLPPKNAEGQTITHRFITSDLLNAIPDLDQSKFKAVKLYDPDNIISNLTIKDNSAGNKGYISFDVGSNIKQSNAVIGLKYTNPDNKERYAWSWHIWFAPENVLNNVPVQSGVGPDNANSQCNMMVCNIGQIYKKNRKTTYANNRELWIKVKQNESNKVSILKVVQRPGKEIEITDAKFQWGRPTAFFMDDSRVINPYDLNGGYLTDENMYYYAIRRCNYYYIDKTISTSIGRDIYYPSSTSLWALGSNLEYGRASNLVWEDQNYPKTLYDPSPAGYKVAPKWAFYNFEDGHDLSSEGTITNFATNSQGLGAKDDYGFYFYRTLDKDPTKVIFFPFTGMIAGTNSTTGTYQAGDKVGVGSSGVVWTSATYYYNNANGVRGSRCVYNAASSENSYGTCHAHQGSQAKICGQAVRPIKE